MTSRLSSDALNQLTPVLGSLARLVARGSQVGQAQLHTLLLGAGLEEEPAALAELQRWLRLLTALREQPSADNRQATVEALLLRGLPEAPVLLAVDTVTQGANVSPAAGESRGGVRLTASVASLNLGTLPPGQGATAEFEVQGGPGRVVAESDQLQVTPLQFGAGPTRIRVEVRPLAGDMLWTTLKLVTPSETLEVPVLAHASTMPGAEKAWVVDPSGRGDYRTVEEAIAQAPPGAVLRLAAGTHRLSAPLTLTTAVTHCLSAPLTLTTAVTLIGEGMDATRLVWDGEEHVVRVSGDGLFSASDVAFIHEGNRWANVVLADKGEVLFRRCRFTGGVRDEDSRRGGSGLWLYGTVRGRVEACQMVGNTLNGIEVGEQAQPTLEGNTCQGNKGSGIAYFGSAGGAARQNTCMGNEHYGIHVDDQAQPMLESNTCRENKLCGVFYFGSAGGAARQNTCMGNEYHGIGVADQAQPTLEGNTCQGNKRGGIAYFGRAGGAARQNTCTGNKYCGIGIAEQAQPTLEGNTCRENELFGIFYFGSAGGAARQNTCMGNEYDGIAIAKQAQPTLEGNTCRENNRSGIAYSGSSGGAARQNTCMGNECHGIHVDDQAQPTLESNTCRENKLRGISYLDNAGGMARNNECTANGEDGIYIASTARPVLKDNRCWGNKGRDVNDQRR